MSSVRPSVIRSLADSQPPPLTFDRDSGAIAGASLRETALLRLFQAGAALSLNWTHKGYGAGCRLLGPVTPARPIDVRLNEDAVFRFPFGDGYWSTILDRGYTYEKDLDAFFRGIADVDYALLDCGANYGYWSVLASSRPYGAKRAVAVEPSSANFARLSENALLNGNRFETIRVAIAATSGLAFLGGAKHESLAISEDPAPGSEPVQTAPLDEIAADRGLFDRPVVVKLDVEGVEIAAIESARALIAADSVFLCEDHGSDRTHAVSRHILKRTPMTLYCYEPRLGRYVRLHDISRLDAIKKATNRGYNVIATASLFWEKRIPT